MNVGWLPRFRAILSGGGAPKRPRSPRWRSAQRIVGGLTLGATLAYATTVGSAGFAEAATPKVHWVRTSTTFTTAFATYSYDYDRPIVSGVAKKISGAVDRTLVTFFTKAIETIKKYDASLSPQELAQCRLAGTEAGVTGKRSADSAATIYSKRYLSIHVSWDAWSCQTTMGLLDDKYLNIDLKTGKSVKLSRLVDDQRGLFALEVGAAMARSPQRDPDGGLGDWHGRNTIAEWRDFNDWTAGPGGVTVYFSWEGFIESYLIRWERILKPHSVKGRKTISSAAYSCSDTHYRLRVTVQGGLAAVRTPDGSTEYGVRGRSRTIWVHATDHDQVIIGQLTFASATSKRATQYHSFSYC